MISGFLLPLSLIQTPLTCAGFSLRQRATLRLGSRHSEGRGAWKKKEEGPQDRRQKSKASESCSEHGIQACEPRDEEVVICSVLMSAELHEQSWHSYIMDYLKLCVLNRNMLETGLLKHCLLYKACLKMHVGNSNSVGSEQRACESEDLTFMTFRFISVSREAPLTVLPWILLMQKHFMEVC